MKHRAIESAKGYIRSIQYDELEEWLRTFSERESLGSSLDERCLLTLQTLMTGNEPPEADLVALAWVIASERQTAMI